jgi:hypothetical protein
MLEHISFFLLQYALCINKLPHYPLPYPPWPESPFTFHCGKSCNGETKVNVINQTAPVPIFKYLSFSPFTATLIYIYVPYLLKKWAMSWLGLFVADSVPWQSSLSYPFLSYPILSRSLAYEQECTANLLPRGDPPTSYIFFLNFTLAFGSRGGQNISIYVSVSVWVHGWSRLELGCRTRRFSMIEVGAQGDPCTATIFWFIVRHCLLYFAGSPVPPTKYTVPSIMESHRSRLVQ